MTVIFTIPRLYQWLRNQLRKKKRKPQQRKSKTLGMSMFTSLFFSFFSSARRGLSRKDCHGNRQAKGLKLHLSTVETLLKVKNARYFYLK
jgi:hypothetical protein